MNQNVCFFNSNKAWGGGEKWNHHFSLLLRDKGYRVFVVTNHNSELKKRLENEPGITLHSESIGNLSFLNPAIMLRLKSFFQQNDIKTVITALPSDVKSGGFAAKCAGVSKVIYRRGIAVPVKNSFLNRQIFSKVVDRLIVNSLETKRTVLINNKNLINESKIRLIHNGFDVVEFDNQPSEQIYTRLGDEVIIGNAARLTAQKGQKFLIEAAEILKKKGLNFRILIAGKGEMEEELKDYSTKHGVSDVVDFIGFVEDMKSFYASQDIFCLPSLWEGFGYALVEAMTLEKPVVGFEISSNPEVVKNGKTGILVPSEDSSQLASALEKLILDAGLRNKMGKAGRERVLNKFNTPLVLGKLIDLIEE
ncbi:Glycosyltransferase involved in cell wall bisynthesis [Maridesulfovibrio ferrireducens]|uniref:Glycosyltransferase involved in cell wall bisynthesis n=1 Tax=Maridesulfovibrio ferrireducens TaxID=246191 RepID=A0A1G9HXE7_9BACT|nr:glycosyltransferase [Maridesulfovibrio ferrireducens]SDL17495.1 Glycosyltransferase involved in cell wall bisynthesis [Maridesulfovibrio ferrireducens]